MNALPDPKPEQVWQLIHTRYYILRQRTCKWQFLREAFTLDVFKYTVRGDVVQVNDARFIQPEVGGGFRDGCMFFEESVASVGFNPVDAAGRNATLPFGTYYDEKITGEMIQSATRRRLPSPPFHTTYIALDKSRCPACFPSCFVKWFPPSSCRECFHLNGEGGCGESGQVTIGRKTDAPQETDAPPAPPPRPKGIPQREVRDKLPYYDF